MLSDCPEVAGGVSGLMFEKELRTRETPLTFGLGALTLFGEMFLSLLE